MEKNKFNKLPIPKAHNCKAFINSISYVWNKNGHYCGYIDFNKNHIFYKLAAELKMDVVYDFYYFVPDPHGGVTYSNLHDNGLVLGFDTGHGGDDELVFTKTGQKINDNDEFVKYELKDWAKNCCKQKTFKQVIKFIRGSLQQEIIYAKSKLIKFNQIIKV
tara:strand:+ start:2838 stop:3320 length:483 start_codon:yes stop_codon:yes gene_type:complete